MCEQAEGGTLFLDEIGDLNLAMQAKLLRVLQERSIKRLGGREEIEVDFRLIAATNHDLRKEITQGHFREDLFFRLNVVSLELPALRHRLEDIHPLCLRFLHHHCKEIGKDINEFDADARTLFAQYPYPGNIRELENIIERAVIFCQGKTVTAADLPRELHEWANAPIKGTIRGNEEIVQIQMTLGKQSLADVETAIIEEVMRLSDSNKSLAAKKLGLTRFALDHRLKKILEEDT